MSKRTVSKTATVQTSEVVQSVQSRIVSLLNRRKSGQWDGTMTDLNRAITVGIGRNIPGNWPGSPSVLRRVVNQALPLLRKSGVKIKFGRTTDHMRTRFVVFSRA